MDAVYGRMEHAFVSAGKTVEDAQTAYMSIGLKVAENVYLTNPERAWKILDRMSAVPGGQLTADTLRTQLESKLNEHDRQEDQRAEVDEQKRRESEFGRTLAEMSQAATTEEGFYSFRDKLLADPETLRIALGDMQFARVYELLDRQESLFLTKDAREREKRIRASNDTRLALENQIQLGGYVSDAAIADSGMELADVLSVRKYKYDMESQTERPRVEALNALMGWTDRDGESHEGFFEQSIRAGKASFELSAMTMPELRFYRRKVMAAIRGIRRDDFPEGDVGDSRYDDALYAAGQEAVDSILAFKDGYRWRNPASIEGDHPRAKSMTPDKIQEVNSGDLEQPENLEAFKRALRGGSDRIKASRSPYGFPLKARLNRKFYDSLDTPEKKRLANDILVQDAIDSYAETYVKSQEQTWIRELEGSNALSRSAQERTYHTYFNKVRRGETSAREQPGYFPNGTRYSLLYNWNMPIGLEPLELNASVAKPQEKKEDD